MCRARGDGYLRVWIGPDRQDRNFAEPAGAHDGQARRPRRQHPAVDVDRLPCRHSVALSRCKTHRGLQLDPGSTKGKHFLPGGCCVGQRALNVQFAVADGRRPLPGNRIEVFSVSGQNRNVATHVGFRPVNYDVRIALRTHWPAGVCQNRESRLSSRSVAGRRLNRHVAAKMDHVAGHGLRALLARRFTIKNPLRLPCGSVLYVGRKVALRDSRQGVAKVRQIGLAIRAKHGEVPQ